MKLIRKNCRTEGSVHVATPRDAIGRRTFLRRSGLTMGGAAVATMLPPTMMRKAAAATGPKEGVATEMRRSICTHCSVGLRRDRRGAERSVDRTGAGFRFPAEPGFALREGRGGARARHRHPPREVPDEAHRRQVEAHELGRRHRRDRRRDAAHPRGVRPGLCVLARLGQAQQRAVLPHPQVRGVLGHEQRRPPGPHLPFDDGRGELPTHGATAP